MLGMLSLIIDSSYRGFLLSKPRLPNYWTKLLGVEIPFLCYFLVTDMFILGAERLSLILLLLLSSLIFFERALPDFRDPSLRDCPINPTLS